MKQKRTKRIEIALTEEEHQTLQSMKTKQRLAEWIRETALQQHKPKKKIKEVDPRLLFELNRIGVNINQIARVCNAKKADINLISIALSLKEIELQLGRLIDNAS